MGMSGRTGLSDYVAVVCGSAHRNKLASLFRGIVPCLSQRGIFPSGTFFEMVDVRPSMPDTFDGCGFFPHTSTRLKTNKQTKNNTYIHTYIQGRKPKRIPCRAANSKK